MTNYELKQYHCYKINIDRNNAEIEKIRDKAEKCTITLTGLPISSGISDKVGNLDADRIIKLEKENIEYEKKIKEIEKYIDSISNFTDQTIFKLWVYDGLYWNEIADLIGGKNTYQTVSKRYYRYLELH